MSQLVPFLIVVACLAVTIAGFGWLGARMRRRGSAGTAVRAAMAAYDEAFYPTANHAHYEVEAQAEAQTPAPSPDDPLRRTDPTNQ